MNTNYISMRDDDMSFADSDHNENNWMKKLPAILRGIGAAAILCSLYSFLMRGWEGSDDLVRYFMLLGHTGLLAAIGLSSGHYLKEGKSARLLIMLSMISVVANFAILGAFIYSEYTGVSLAQYPQYVAWSVDSPISAAFTALATIMLLVPVIIIGFRVLSRGMSKKMSILYIISNAALLIPLRDPVLVAVLAAALGSYTLLFNITTTRQRTEAKTHEGMFALLLQFLPIMTLLIRNIWLYSFPGEEILFASTSLMGFIALRQCTLHMKNASWLRIISDMVSMVLAIVTGISVCASVGILVNSYSFAIILGTVIAALMCYEISLRAYTGAGLYRVMTSIILVTGLFANFTFNSDVWATMSLILVGLIMIAMSYTLKQRVMLLGGLLLFVVGLGNQFINLFEIFDFSYWIATAVMGVSAILLASLLESKGSSIKQTLIIYKARYAEWSY